MALALKYRPTHFKDLIGQDAVSKTLSLALQKQAELARKAKAAQNPQDFTNAESSAQNTETAQSAQNTEFTQSAQDSTNSESTSQNAQPTEILSHAYLFSGLRGSGKTSSARIFARALQCQNYTTEPCDTCANCVAALEGRHIDIIEMDGASNRGIAEIKGVIEHTKYRPQLGAYKVFIIDEVHMLTREAFNALLKTLEEPPPFVKFILATTDPLKLPATILSRTQHFRFKQIARPLVLSHITNICQKEGVEYEEEALKMIARSGNGSLRDTLTLLDQAIVFCQNRLSVAKVGEMLSIVDPKILADFFGAVLSRADDAKIAEILAVLGEHEADMVIDEAILFLKERMSARDPLFAPVLIDRFFRILVDAKRLLAMNTNAEFVLLLMSLKFKEALKINDIEAMISQMEREVGAVPPARASTPAVDSAVADVKNPASENRAEIEKSTPQNPPSADVNNEVRVGIFPRIITAMFDRNMQLGEIFQNCVSFVSFENGVLSLKSRAAGENREFIRKNFSVIKTIICEICGAGTKISVEQVEGDGVGSVESSSAVIASRPQDGVAIHNENPSNASPSLNAIDCHDPAAQGLAMTAKDDSAHNAPARNDGVGESSLRASEASVAIHNENPSNASPSFNAIDCHATANAVARNDDDSSARGDCPFIPDADPHNTKLSTQIPTAAQERATQETAQTTQKQETTAQQDSNQHRAFLAQNKELIQNINATLGIKDMIILQDGKPIIGEQ